MAHKQGGEPVEGSATTQEDGKSYALKFGLFYFMLHLLVKGRLHKSSSIDVPRNGYHNLLRRELRNTYIFQSGPPMHPIFGHLISVGKVAVKLPARAHPHLLASHVQKEYDLPGMFFLDTRPVSSLNLVVADP
jgi:hypothetical protein